jgi:multicomponent Na+:H+ antiporter subunit E
LTFFTFLWLAFAQNQKGSWLVGIPTILLACFSSFYVWKRHHVTWRLSVLGILGFIMFFIKESLKCGYSLCKFLLKNNISLESGIVEYDTVLNSSLARLIFSNAITLLPGTFTIEIRNRLLLIHVLDLKSDYLSDLKCLEQKVAGMFQDERGPL